jgi:hypothetical protein
MSAIGIETPRVLRVIVPVGGTPTAAQELEIVAGSGVTLTGTRTGARVELEIAASGGGGGVSDHGALTGLSDDDHAQYALLAGRAGGQTLKGGTASGEVLTLQSTAHATRGYVYSVDRMVVGDPGSESAGININGTTYTAVAQFNEIGGGRGGIELHGHSTTHPIYMLGSRSNSDTSAHSSITTSMELLTILATGWTGSHYDQCASIELRSGAGTISGTSSPGEIRLRTTADGAQTPTTRVTIGSDGVVAVAGSMTLGTPLAAAQGGTGATALGDLAVSGGSIQVSQARGLRETAGPTTLTMGAVADGQLLRRSGSTIIGAYIILGTLTPAQSGPYNVLVGTATGEAFTGSTWA